MPSSKFRLLICSGNMGNAEPDIDSIAAWLPKDGAFFDVVDREEHQIPTHVRFEEDSTDEKYFDAIVIGMQEATFDVKELQRKNSSSEDFPLNSPEKILTDNIVIKGAERVGKEFLNTVQQFAGSKDHTKKKKLINLGSDWVGGTKVMHDLIEKQCPSYDWIVAFQRGQMRMIILTRKDSPHIMELETVKAENTGIASVAANKGGILSILNVNETRLGFISAHLEAHEGTSHYLARCANLAEILGGTSSSHSGLSYDASLTTHFCFVCGDLNFRTDFDSIKDKKAQAAKARDLVASEKWEELYEADELQKALRQKDCLVGFETLPCEFSPTFKVEREEGFHYKESRTPSYTDRILWKCAHELKDHVQPLAYEPIEAFRTSDHKPIRGAFEITLNEEIIVAHETGPRLSRRRSMRNLFGAVDYNDDNLHLFFNELSCTNLKSKAPSQSVKPDPYITFVSRPKELVRKERTKWQKLKHKLLLTSRTLTKQDSDGVVERTSRGWTRTSKKTNCSNPDWSGEEVHLVMKAAANKQKNDTSTDLTGALLFITVHDQKSVMEDNVIGTFALNLAHLYIASKEKAVSLTSSLQSGESNSRPDGGRRGSMLGIFGMTGNNQGGRLSTMSGGSELKTIDIDEPLLRNGKEQGRIRCSIDTWWINDQWTQAEFAQRRHTVEKERSHWSGLSFGHRRNIGHSPNRRAALNTGNGN